MRIQPPNSPVPAPVASLPPHGPGRVVPFSTPGEILRLGSDRRMANIPDVTIRGASQACTANGGASRSEPTIFLKTNGRQRYASRVGAFRDGLTRMSPRLTNGNSAIIIITKLRYNYVPSEQPPSHVSHPSSRESNARRAAQSSD